MTLQQLREGGYTMDPAQWLAVSYYQSRRLRHVMTLSA